MQCVCLHAHETGHNCPLTHANKNMLHEASVADQADQDQELGKHPAALRHHCVHK